MSLSVEIPEAEAVLPVQLVVTVIYPAGNFGRITKAYPIQIKIDWGDDYGSVLERIFRMMNRVDGSEIEKWLETYQCRSLSVGDFVIFPSGKMFRCANCGWKEIHD